MLQSLQDMLPGIVETMLAALLLGVLTHGVAWARSRRHKARLDEAEAAFVKLRDRGPIPGHEKVFAEDLAQLKLRVDLLREAGRRELWWVRLISRLGLVVVMGLVAMAIWVSSTWDGTEESLSGIRSAGWITVGLLGCVIIAGVVAILLSVRGTRLQERAERPQAERPGAAEVG